MLKVYAFLAKLPALSDEAFFAHWTDPHGTLTQRIPQFRRYVQNRGLGAAAAVPGFAPTPYLGIATIWVDDLAALAEANAHPDYPQLDADGDAMYLRAQLVWLIARETVVRPAFAERTAQPVKAMLFLKAGMRPLTGATLHAIVDEAQRRLPRLAGAAVAVPLDPAGAPYDGVIELTFADEVTFRADWIDAADLPRAVSAVADMSASRGFLAREARVIWPGAVLAEAG